jgi:hypothetical protein
MRRHRHRHKPICLYFEHGCPGIGYVEWLELAATQTNQDKVWREHERIGRSSESIKRELMPWYYDFGGEG